MKVIAVANQKGGVGKSTLSANLGVAAALDGKKVMIIDADPQGSSMQWRAQRESENVSVISITKNTIVKEIKNFDNFDLVIVDAGGRDNSLLRAAIMTGTYGMLLVPVLASAVDVWATADTFTILDEARSIGANIPTYAVFNQVKANAVLVPQAKEALAELTEGNDITLLETRIGDREDFKKGFLNGQGVLENAPKGKAAIEIKELYNEIMTILNLN
jgi:chromosome partitioning protein